MLSSWINQTTQRLKALFRRRELDRDLQDEMAFHLEMREEKKRALGVDAEEARHMARRQFGNVTQARERARELWTLGWLETVWQDVRFGARALRKYPGFTAVAVLTLALGIGANTAIFSLIHSVLLQPLPFFEPDRLVRLFSDRGTADRLPVNGEDYFDWAAQNHSFGAMCIFSSPQDFNASGAGHSETISVVGTQANFLSVLGVQPLAGRTFAEGEDKPGADRVALLSYAFWQRHFGGTRDVIGKKLSLNFQVYTVVGVLPPSFNYPESVQVWIPLEMAVDRLGRRGNYSYRVLARLKPGVTAAQAQADMSTIAKRLAEEFPVNNSNLGVRLVPLKELFTGDARPQLLVLLGAVAMVLLVACSNVASLLLARATGRQREIVLRAALGASRWRLVRQLLTESVILSCCGAALGLTGAWWLVRLARTMPSLPIPRQNPVQLDGPVLLFTAGVAVVVGILFGLAPALEASRLNVTDALKSTASSVVGGVRSRLALRNALVIAEIAVSLALLTGAGLLLRSFAEMRRANLGVHTEHILTAAVVLPDTKYKAIPARREFYERLLERLEQIPGVSEAAISQQIPLEGSHSGSAKLESNADSRSNGLVVNWNFVTPSYFPAFRIPFVSGRNFAPEEVERAGVVGASVFDYWDSHGKELTTPQPQWSTFAIINRTMAQALWPNGEAVGKVFLSSLFQPVTVVGVVGDEKYGGIREPAAPEAYFPFTEELANKWYPPNIVTRSSRPPETILGDIREVVRGLDSELSLFRVRTMDQVVADNMQDTTLQTVLLGAFAALGLVLSAVGVYGVMAYQVTQRTREIGIRMALGAKQRDILQIMVGRGSRLAAAGIAAGILASLVLTRFMKSLLFGVTTTDTPTFSIVIAVLAVVALAASYLPAHRAARVDPMVALRYE